MGSLATNEALALLLLGLAASVVVYYSTESAMLPRSGALLGAPILVLANLVRYGSLEFDPIVLGLLLSLTWERYDGRQAVRQTVMFAAIVAAFLCAILDFAGTAFTWAAVRTTFAGGPSTVSRGTILRDLARWVGPLAFLALLSAAALVLRRLSNRFQPQSTWTWPTGVGVVLALGVVVAPLDQLRTGHPQALADHAAVGAWFAALIVGFMLAQVLARRRRASRCVGLIAVAVVLAGLFGAGIHESGRPSEPPPGAGSPMPVLRSLSTFADGPALPSHEVQG